MVPDGYIWLLWSSLFLVPWVGLYMAFPGQRRAMAWASVFTAPFGLTEPLFVPEYWNPPSLFNLAQTTGFDIESLIFCFGIGGVGAVLYNVLTGRRERPTPESERRRPLHRHHYLALASPFITFLVLVWFPWNTIYPGIIAMFVGAVANILCRPDLRRKTWMGGVLFLLYYFLFFASLKLIAPGYVKEVWNHDALTGLHVLWIPIEELLFAAGFGMYWAGVYEHFTWRTPVGAGVER